MISTCLTAANIRSRRDAFQNMALRPTAYRLLCCFGIPCYSVSPAGAERLTSLALPIRPFTITVPGVGEIHNSSVDIALIGICKEINAYVSFPPLILTANERSISTVQNP